MLTYFWSASTLQKNKCPVILVCTRVPSNTYAAINQDPFVMTETNQTSILPPEAVTMANALTSLAAVDGSDLVSYLVLRTSFVTAKQFEAHKSAEAYNQFVCAWVKDVKTWNVCRKCVVTGKVNTSVEVAFL